jgi:hypothetical protein
MELPIKFPHPADVIAEAVERDRHLTVEQRLDRLGQLYLERVALEALDLDAQNRRHAEKRESERQWRDAHQRVIQDWLKRHGEFVEP